MEIGIARQAKAGSRVSGDAPLVVERGRYTVIALADGLGSGEKAAHSARLAVQGVEELATEALQDILAYCHYTILAAGGVGVMMAILRLDPIARALEFCGVGNIRFQAHSREPIQPIVRYGYLGVRLPSLHVYRFSYTPGDAFVLHTDGVSTRFHLHNHIADLQDGAQSLAERILGQYGKEHDDATVIVVRT
ncbi:MAG: SpoIIE family protein phosphatase [Chloroflexia bacterium]